MVVFLIFRKYNNYHISLSLLDRTQCNTAL